MEAAAAAAAAEESGGTDKGRRDQHRRNGDRVELLYRNSWSEKDKFYSDVKKKIF